MAGKKLKDQRTSVEMAALKALIKIYGPREAARKANVPEGTMLFYARKHKIKKAIGFKPEKDVVLEAIEDAFAKDREATALNLATYARKASEKAAKHADPLEVARKVRDVAGVYATIWPPGESEELIEGAILLGGMQPTVNVAEVQARAKEIEDVRTELPEQRPAGD